MALEQYPVYQAYTQRLKGELLVKVGHYKEAELLYTQVLAFRDLPWAKLGLAVAKGYQEQDSEAEGMLLELVEQPETKIEALDWLTRLYLSQNKVEEAFNTVRIVAEASPKNYLRQHVLANLAVINEQPDLAVRIHSKLLEAAKADGIQADGSFSLSANFGEQAAIIAGIKVDAPERVHPTGDVTIDQALERIQACSEVFDSLKADLESFDLSGHKFPHPFIGDMDAGEWLVMAGLHKQRHLKQIEGLLAIIRQ